MKAIWSAKSPALSIPKVPFCGYNLTWRKSGKLAGYANIEGSSREAIDSIKDVYGKDLRIYNDDDDVELVVVVAAASAAATTTTTDLNSALTMAWCCKTSANHRLNGSSSPVLTATPHSYGKGQNSTPYTIKTPERIGIEFGIVDYVLDISLQNKFGDDRCSGGFWVNM